MMILDKDSKHIQELKKQLSLLEKQIVSQNKQDAQDKDKDLIPESSLVPYDLSKASGFFGKLKIKWWLRRWPLRLILIEMELRSGDIIDFVTLTDTGIKNQSFVFQGGRYILQDTAKKYIRSCGYWRWRYHQDFSLPITETITPSSLRELVAEQKPGVVHSCSPYLLETFTESKIAEGIMRGQELGEYLRQTRLLLIITMIGVFLHFLVYVQKTGGFKALLGAS